MPEIKNIVRVILEDESQKVLLLRRSLSSKCEPGKWNLPGGKVEYGESLEIVCIREIEEETALKIFDLEYRGVTEGLNQKEGDLHCIHHYFKAEYTGKVKINEESSDYAWVSREKLGDYNVAFGDEIAINRYK